MLSPVKLGIILIVSMLVLTGALIIIENNKSISCGSQNDILTTEDVMVSQKQIEGCKLIASSSS